MPDCKCESCDMPETIRPKVRIVEVDFSMFQPGPMFCNALVGFSSKGPLQEPIRIGPKTPAVRWWEFWRWPFARQIERKRQQEAIDKLHEVFGPPEPLHQKEGEGHVD